MRLESVVERLAMSSPFGAAARAQFSLQSGAIFLNHGSFGAVPRVVQAAQAEWRAVMERQPDVFFRRTMKPGIRAACEVLASLLGVAGEELAMVENATTAISTVLQRMTFAPGDEIMITDTTYNAVKLAVADECCRTGAVPRIVTLPLPYTSDDDVAARILAAAGPRTRLAILDHIVSPTAIVLPVARIARELKTRNIRVLIDGAHGPGQAALNLPALNADWVTGNLHKWLYMPRGSAYFWAAADVRDITLPLNISHDAGLGFSRAFDYTGTRDATAWLCMPDALMFAAEFGLDRIMAHNAALARMGAMLFERLGAKPMAGDAHFAAMRSLQLPTRGPAEPAHATQLLNAMWDQHQVQIAASAVHGRLLLRLSAQIYCTLDDFARAAEALDELGWPGRV
jgi:isopenicillin-N epimerase